MEITQCYSSSGLRLWPQLHRNGGRQTRMYGSCARHSHATGPNWLTQCAVHTLTASTNAAAPPSAMFSPSDRVCIVAQHLIARSSTAHRPSPSLVTVHWIPSPRTLHGHSIIKPCRISPSGPVSLMECDLLLQLLKHGFFDVASFLSRLCEHVCTQFREVLFLSFGMMPLE